MRYRESFQILFLLCLLVLPSVAASGTGEDRVSKWTGKHTRLVWVQDQGAGTDTFGQGTKLMLYGYDSLDGRGERPLLPVVGNFFKPLLTPDGDNVIVSNRKGRQMYQVEWETGMVKELGSGVAVAIWKDPKPSLLLRKSTTWVYCFAGLQPENKYGTAQPLYRFPLDKPEKKELVWNKTNLAWSNLQLSRDGEVIGGLFPWPHGGVLWAADKRWQRFGRGCWTSLSPDNSKLLWIFDGLHRNVQIYDVAGGTNWKVNINGAPGIGGFEVYHPRWSNHPRYFVITGPYEKGEGGNRIGGGGEKVEIFIGRLDEQARGVEDWLKVTDNRRADFYPDLWVEGGEKMQLADKVAQNSSEVLAASWPAFKENLVFVWENMKAANQLGEQSPVGFYQCNIELRGRALHTSNLQLATGGGWGETGEAGGKIGAALAGSGKAGVEFVVTPEQNLKGTIMSFASGGKARLLLKQEGDALIVQTPGGEHVAWPQLLEAGKSQHLVLSFEGGKLELFKDGRSMGKKLFPINFAAPVIDSFVIGDSAGAWNGLLENIAIYDTPLSADKISRNSRLALDEAADRSGVQEITVEGKLIDMTEIPAPDSIGAYRRALVVNTYSVDKVLQGEYQQERVLVAEWAILDREIIKKYSFPAVTEQLNLEKFDDHPELEGERQMMDIFEPDLEMYYRLPGGGAE
jgi:hypothetical protein